MAAELWIGSLIFVVVGVVACIIFSLYASSRTRDETLKSENQT